MTCHTTNSYIEQCIWKWWEEENANYILGMGNEGVSVCLVACGTTSAPYENEDDDTLSPIFTHLASPKESRPETQQFAASLETFANDKKLWGILKRISNIFLSFKKRK